MRDILFLPLRRLASSRRPHYLGNIRQSSQRLFASISVTDPKFGQPLPETHPHLLRPGELTQGITALEYHHRRSRLCERLPPNSIAVISSAEVKYRSGAVFYEFRQDSNFAYLTGFLEPEAFAIIEKRGSGSDYIFHLFVRPKDARAEQWDGPRSGVEAARDVFNADESDDVKKASSILRKLVGRKSFIYTDLPKKERAGVLRKALSTSGVVSEMASTGLSPDKIRPLSKIMNDLRLVKSDAELDCMRRAGRISGNAIADVMRTTPDDERQLWIALSHGYKSRGLAGDAYVPVVAGGSNALSIHYVRNDALLQKEDLVLVDSGGEYGGYVTDITRTWPVNGRFSNPQRDMYNMILGVQEKCINLCREDAQQTLDQLHELAEVELKKGLQLLGFDMSGDSLDILFPHHVGHYVGLDVHDAPGMVRSASLRTNQCITIEPGVYIPDEPRWPAHFRRMGIRIEDTVRVGPYEPEVLSFTAPKSVKDIEMLREIS